MRMACACISPIRRNKAYAYARKDSMRFAVSI